MTVSAASSTVPKHHKRCWFSEAPWWVDSPYPAWAQGPAAGLLGADSVSTEEGGSEEGRPSLSHPTPQSPIVSGHKGPTLRPHCPLMGTRRPRGGLCQGRPPPTGALGPAWVWGCLLVSHPEGTRVPGWTQSHKYNVGLGAPAGLRRRPPLPGRNKKLPSSCSGWTGHPSVPWPGDPSTPPLPLGLDPKLLGLGHRPPFLKSSQLLPRAAAGSRWLGERGPWVPGLGGGPSPRGGFPMV